MSRTLIFWLCDGGESICWILTFIFVEKHTPNYLLVKTFSLWIKNASEQFFLPAVRPIMTGLFLVGTFTLWGLAENQTEKKPTHIRHRP